MDALPLPCREEIHAAYLRGEEGVLALIAGLVSMTTTCIDQEVKAMSGATHVEINHDEEPVRLFQSGFLEFFTHIHPVVVLVIWLPVVVYFLAASILDPAPRGAGSIPLGFLVGVALWTFTEYTLHRFVFHFRPRSPAQEKIVFLFHGIHHLQPQCKTRLVMPPAVSVPLAFLFYAVFYLVLGRLLGLPHWIGPAFAGFVAGYLAYDMTHYATHHIPMRRGILKYLKRHHMLHHYKTPDQRFGVTSPIWDYVFGTQPAR
jgi:sterol desaturase/sphingolipid hydroxylase (fatty acid hydroxylase superfamily)